jgi:hypothetical protein
MKMKYCQCQLQIVEESSHYHHRQFALIERHLTQLVFQIISQINVSVTMAIRHAHHFPFMIIQIKSTKNHFWMGGPGCEFQKASQIKLGNLVESIPSQHISHFVISLISTFTHQIIKLSSAEMFWIFFLNKWLFFNIWMNSIGLPTLRH